jgi:hypothetical protein
MFTVELRSALHGLQRVGVNTAGVTAAAAKLSEPLPALEMGNASDAAHELAADIAAGRVDAAGVAVRIAAIDAAKSDTRVQVAKLVTEQRDRAALTLAQRDADKIAKELGKLIEQATAERGRATDAMRAAGVELPQDRPNEIGGLNARQVAYNSAVGLGSAALAAYEAWRSAVAAHKRIIEVREACYRAALLSRPVPVVKTIAEHGRRKESIFAG